MNNDPEVVEEPYARLPRGLAPLGYRNFALFWVGFVTSNTGRWMELTGAVWVVSELTDSAALLGMLGVTRAVPAILLGPIAGVVADRSDQRRLLLLTQALSLVASLALGVIVAAGMVELWHVYVQVALQAGLNSFDASGRQALFPRLVPRSQIGEAVTLSATAGRTSKLVGPMIAGVAIATWGEAAPFLINSATFPVLMAAVVLMRGVIPMSAVDGSTFRGELAEGLRHIMGVPVLRGMVNLEVVFGLFSMNAVMITIMGREVLDVGPKGLGGLLAAPALGSLAGIACLLAFGQMVRQGRFFIIATMGYAVALVGFAVAWDYTSAFIALAIIGLGDALAMVTRHSVMQLAAPARMRGRIMGNLGTVTRGVSPLAESQSGLLATALGPRLAIVTAASVLVVSSALTPRTYPELWRFSSDEALVDPPPDIPVK